MWIVISLFVIYVIFVITGTIVLIRTEREIKQLDKTRKQLEKEIGFILNELIERLS